jgi:hypothetical protein
LVVGNSVFATVTGPMQSSTAALPRRHSLMWRTFFLRFYTVKLFKQYHEYDESEKVETMAIKLGRDEQYGYYIFRTLLSWRIYSAL